MSIRSPHFDRVLAAKVLRTHGYSEGDRVRYSAKGVRFHPQTNTSRCGTVVGAEAAGALVVHWDDLKNPRGIHPAFIEKHK